MAHVAEVDAVGEVAWNQLVCEFDDANIFQTWGYGAERWGAGHLSHLVLKVDGSVRGLAQVALIGGPVIGHRLGYVIGGPLCARIGHSNTAASLRATVAAVLEEYAARRHLYVRFRPLNYTGSTVAEAMASVDGVRRAARSLYRTYVVDITRSEAELLSAMDRRWRYNLRRSFGQGLRVSDELPADGIPIFAKLQEELMHRKRFSSDFRGMLRPLFARLPPGLSPKIFVCWAHDEPVAAAIVSAMGRGAFYLNGATSQSALRQRAGYFLQWEIISWLRTQPQCRWYDLYGAQASKGVRQFKKGLVGRHAEETVVTEFESSGSPLTSFLVGAGKSLGGTLRRLSRTVR